MTLPKVYRKCMDGLPKINPILGNGMAYYQQNQFEAFFDHIVRCGSESFPPNLHYLGYERATPEETFAHLTRPIRSKRQFDIAPTDVYYCKFHFKYENEPLPPMFVAMPYIRRGGIMRIRAGSYTVSPVLEDKLFSVTRDCIHFPLNRAKINFKKVLTSIRVDGVVRVVDVVHGESIHNKMKKSNSQSGKKTVLAHYLFGQYGVRESFKRFFNCDVVCGLDDITNENFPRDKWVICSSYGVRPSSKGHRGYVPTKIRLAIPREQYTPPVEALVGGFYYIVDRFPDMVDLECLDWTLLWRRLLTQLINLNVEVEKKALEEMDAHFESLEQYMDDLIRSKLAAAGLPNDSFFSVLAYLIEHFEAITLSAKPSNMIEEKRLDVVRPFFRELITCVSRIAFAMMHLSGNRLNEKNVRKEFSKRDNFPSEHIKNVNSGHGAVTVLNSATDCFLYSVTKALVPQNKLDMEHRPKMKTYEMRDPALALDATQAAVSTFQFITKGDPTGRSSINHFLELNPDGSIRMNAELEATLNAVAKAIVVK